MNIWAGARQLWPGIAPCGCPPARICLLAVCSSLCHWNQFFLLQIQLCRISSPLLGVFRQGGKEGHICSCRHRRPFLAHTGFLICPVCLEPDLSLLPLRACLHQGCDLVRRVRRTEEKPNFWATFSPGYWSGCRADTQDDVEPLVSFVKTCAIVFLCYTTYRSPNYKLTLCDPWCNEQFLWGFLFWEVGGKGARYHPALHLYFGPKM